LAFRSAQPKLLSRDTIGVASLFMFQKLARGR